jgi:hypothetical protein
MRIASLTAPQGPAGSFEVSVSVTPPAAISAAVGVYVALSAEAFGRERAGAAAPGSARRAAADRARKLNRGSGPVHAARSAPASAVAIG